MPRLEVLATSIFSMAMHLADKIVRIIEHKSRVLRCGSDAGGRRIPVARRYRVAPLGVRLYRPFQLLPSDLVQRHCRLLGVDFTVGQARCGLKAEFLLTVAYNVLGDDRPLLRSPYRLTKYYVLLAAWQTGRKALCIQAMWVVVQRHTGWSAAPGGPNLRRS